MIWYCWIKETVGEHFRRRQESPVYKQRKYKCNLTTRGSFFTESCAEPCRYLFHFHYSNKGLELAIHHIVFFVPRSQNMNLIVNYREQKSFNSTGNIAVPDATCVLFLLSSLCGTCSAYQGHPTLFFINNVNSVSSRLYSLLIQSISETERRPS